MDSRNFITIFGLALFQLGCIATEKQETADLARIYNPAASKHTLEFNPVIVIPGVMGSKLLDSTTGKSLWGDFDTNYIDLTQRNNLPLLALPLHGQKDSARGHPNGVLDLLKFRALGMSNQQEVYAGIMGALGVGGFLDQQLSASKIDWGKEHFTCFQFSYDWRLSNAANALRLHEFILEKRAYIRRHTKEIYGNAKVNVKFNIVAHSMGGLVARYYLRYGNQALPKNGSQPKLNWAGAKYVDQLIMIGTPNAGSILTFNDLSDGLNLIPHWKRLLFDVSLPEFSPTLIASYPSTFEMLPRTRHQPVLNLADNAVVDLFDVELWDRQGWGILNPSEKENWALHMPELNSAEERRAAAKEHLRYNLKRAQQFQQALDRPAKPPSSLRISLFAGDSINTPRQIKIDLNTNERTDNDYLPGDGIVLRHSALCDERVGSSQSVTQALKSPISFSKVTFLPYEHIELTNNKTFIDNLLYQLLEQP